jgi:type I restriction-modification system DNA methylase subunit
MKISNEVLNILEKSKVDGNKLYLPPGQLDRKLYEAINKVLVCLGGKWDKKTKSHIFTDDIAEAIDTAMLLGEVDDIIEEKKEFQFFRTPNKLAERIVKLAEIEDGHSVLEPSAGDGVIALTVVDEHEITPDCCELNPRHREVLKEAGLKVKGDDFLEFEGSYDRIVANPPFTRQQDVDHVLHMYEILAKGGILVSVMSPSWQFRENKKSKGFRDFLEKNEAEVIELPEGTFKESGTMIRTCIVKIRK